jgi:glycosyltransferase involved in cell wall biosynthesis
MKIGVNARLLLNGPLEGLGRYTFETVCQMAKDHPDDEFFLFFDRKIEKKYLQHPNMFGILIYCPTRHPFLILFWFEILLPYYLKKLKIDVFYSADNFLSLRTTVPTILICHDLAYINFSNGIRKDYLFYYKFFTPQYLKKAASIGTVSEYVRSDIFQSFPNVKEVFVAPNALPSHQLNYQKTSERQKISKPYFIYVGSIHPRKNIEKMLSAFLRFNLESNNKYAFIIVGRLAWGNKNVEHLLNSDNIHHIMDAGDNVKFEYIKNSIGLVYLSFSEGFGIPILEGFASNVPVITSNVSSMPEVGREAVIKVNPRSEEEIILAFKKISTDTLFRSELIAKGKERLKLFSWKNSSEIIYNYLLKQLQKSK